jgi:hypothetical protein
VPCQRAAYALCLMTPFCRSLQTTLNVLQLLQGEVISESGTMTGGGGKPRRGKMRVGSGAPAAASSDDGKDVVVLERDLQQLQKVPAGVPAIQVLPAHDS